jgi:electron transfer flavoprotein alpha subunit
MNAAFILNACSQLFEMETSEINRFYRSLSKTCSAKAWIINPYGIPLYDKLEKLSISNVLALEIRTPNSSEEMLSALKNAYEIEKPEFLVFPGDFMGSELAVRLACKTGGSSCVGVVSCEVESGDFFAEKPVYSNNLSAKFRLKTPPFCISVSKISALAEHEPCEHTVSILPPSDFSVHFPESEIMFIPSEEEKGLQNAKFVLVVGNGAGSRENVERLKAAAQRLGAEFGASRPVVMNAWAEISRLIGASGMVLSPELCIAAAVSGAAAFMFGISGSKFIVAINNDENAPIFKSADVAVVDDCGTILNALQKIIENEKL